MATSSRLLGHIYACGPWMHRFLDKDKGLLEKGLVQIKLVLESWFLLFGDLDADMAFIIGTYLPFPSDNAHGCPDSCRLYTSTKIQDPMLKL